MEARAAPPPCANKSRRPKETHDLEREKVDKILGIRDRIKVFGCSKIAFDVECSSSTVHKYLRIHSRPMRIVSKRRFRSFERKHSNSMWQMDYTQLRKDIWVLQIVDRIIPVSSSAPKVMSRLLTSTIPSIC